MSKLAILGGPRSVTLPQADMFNWPIVNKAMEDGVLDVLRTGNMSGTDITKKFEQKFADWHGVKYGLAHNTGTSAIHSAFYGMGIGKGDEVISPSITYWATCLCVLSLGARVVFCDVNPDTICMDPEDIEKRITKRTKAICVVHYMGMPADMDAIMDIAKRHKLKVFEDVSHAHGGLYKGQLVGTFGDVAGFSLMSGKSFAIGEGGIMITNDRDIYERAIIFGHYERHCKVTNPDLKAAAGVPWGGYKYRMHQMSSVVGMEQLKKYPAEMQEIDKAMNYFWDLLEGVPGIRAHRPAKGTNSTMGGWYGFRGLYRPEELEGLSVERFVDAVLAEGSSCCVGCNSALHQHPVFNTVDVYNEGYPTNQAGIPAEEAPRQDQADLPVSDMIQTRVYGIPWFKHFRKDIIEEHAAAFRKVAENYKDLLPGDTKPEKTSGQWGLTARKN